MKLTRYDFATILFQSSPVNSVNFFFFTATRTHSIRARIPDHAWCPCACPCGRLMGGSDTAKQTTERLIPWALSCSERTCVQPIVLSRIQVPSTMGNSDTLWGAAWAKEVLAIPISTPNGAWQVQGGLVGPCRPTHWTIYISFKPMNIKRC